ncbi:hypothetical protein L9F63_025767, partial [Diploptera punctata]
CGKKIAKGQAFISGGNKSEVGEFPWNIGVYREDKGKMMQICAGSLVNPDTVISAAHCFWNESYNRAVDISRFEVAAGKYYRDWNVEDSEIQKRKLAEVIIHDEYRGRNAHYSSDIAILKLDKAVELKWAVLPVCLDLNNEYERFQLYNGSLGN